ncbi:hypothetical protein ACFYVL_06535 [Streptomyces sp. NPDC004111]|uniref:hypothetical protein n=1 Tax=Streptomyces sp. NPDC004111 TaxID=3364690 RepID=UPI00368B1D5C
MRKRTMGFGLYADEDGLATVTGLVHRAVRASGARLLSLDLAHRLPHSGTTAEEAYDFLAEQWAIEHPGQDAGARRAVLLSVRLECSLKTWRTVRKAVLHGLCPQGTAPHVCRVPWTS